MREYLFAAVLLVAAAAFVAGVAITFDEGPAWMVGGVLGAVWGWAVLSDTESPAES